MPHPAGVVRCCSKIVSLAYDFVFFFYRNIIMLVRWLVEKVEKKRFCLFLILGLVSLPVVADNGELAEEIALIVH